MQRANKVQNSLYFEHVDDKNLNENWQFTNVEADLYVVLCRKHRPFLRFLSSVNKYNGLRFSLNLSWSSRTGLETKHSKIWSLGRRVPQSWYFSLAASDIHFCLDQALQSRKASMKNTTNCLFASHFCFTEERRREKVGRKMASLGSIFSF